MDWRWERFRINGGDNTNWLDLSIPLGAYADKDLILQYDIKDRFNETTAGEGIYFSDDGGQNFTQVYGFQTGVWSDSYGTLPALDLDELALENGLVLNDEFCNSVCSDR